MGIRARAVVAGLGLPGVAMLLACASSPPDLSVDLKTDLRTPQDFLAVRTTVSRAGDGAALGRQTTAAFEVVGSLIAGVRVAELADLPTGSALVRVELVDAVGTVVVVRRVALRLEQDTAVTVVITRSCVGVVCPLAGGDPLATECLGGRCVTPDCTATTLAACGMRECTTAAECATPAACVTAACEDGACLRAASDARCAPGERCDLAAGCTSGCSMASCDDGQPCTDDACGAGGCTHTPNTAACSDGVFCNGADTCASGACTVHAGDPCAAPTVCDPMAATCVGCTIDGDCPDPLAGPWSACMGFATTCAETGMRSRTETTFTCVAAACRGVDMSTGEACARVTTDDPCGPSGARCAGGACVCPGGAAETACGDARDDDCDGDVDCADSDCAAMACGGGGAVCSAGTCSCAAGAPTALTDGTGALGAPVIDHYSGEFQ